jgi:hypothetical protein
VGNDAAMQKVIDLEHRLYGNNGDIQTLKDQQNDLIEKQSEINKSVDNRLKHLEDKWWKAIWIGATIAFVTGGGEVSLKTLIEKFAKFAL